MSELSTIANKIEEMGVPPSPGDELSLIADQLEAKDKMLGAIPRKRPEDFTHEDFGMTPDEFTRQFHTPVTGIDMMARRGVPREVMLGPDYHTNLRANISESVSQRISQELAKGGFILNPSDIDIDVNTTEGIGFRARAKLSFADNPDEFVQAFQKEFPDGMIFSVPVKQPKVAMPQYIGARQPVKHELIFKRDIFDPDEKFKTMNTEGFRLQDVGAITGSLPELTGATIAAFMTGGSSLFMQAAAAGGGVFLGSLGEEAVETVTDYPQTETMRQVFTRAGKEGGLTGLIILGLGGLIKMGSGIKQNQAIGQLVSNYEKAVDVLAKEGGMSKSRAAKILLFQDLADHPIVERLSQQAVSTTRSFQQQLRDLSKMPKIGLEAMRNANTDFSKSVLRAQQGLQGAAQRQYKIETAKLKGVLRKLDAQYGAVDVKRAQTALQKGTQKWIKDTGQSVSKKWNAISDFADKNALRYDWSDLKLLAKEVRQRFVGAQGMEGQVNVAEEVTNQILAITDDIVKSTATQTNHAAIDSIRKRIGALFERTSMSGVNTGDLRRLYKAASNTMRNPTNLPDEQLVRYQGLVDDAIGSASARFDAIGLTQTRAILNSGNHGELIEAFSKPNGISLRFGDDIINSPIFKDMFPEKQLSIIRQGVRARMLAEKNPLEAFHAYRVQDSKGFRVLFPDSQTENFFKTVAEKVTKLNQSPIAEAARAASPRQAALKIIRDKNLNASSVNKYLDSMDKVGRENLRFAIYDDILQQAMKEPGKLGLAASDELIINPVSMLKAINELKRTGLWESRTLLAEDRKVIQGMLDYAKLSSRIGEDVGVSLEAAQAITQIKSVLNPLQVMSGAHKLAANKFIAMAMQSQTLRKLLINTGRGGIIQQTPERILAPVIVEMESAINRQAENAEGYNEVLFSTLEEEGIATRAEIMQAVRELQEEE